MIISASRRTDLPAFYPEWTIKEILKLCKAEQQHIIPSKHPEHGVVFWTKNPQPITPYLHILDKNNIVYYFQYTLNNYPLEIEPDIPPLGYRIKSYYDLGGRIGFDKIKIRFDPILISIYPELSLQTVLGNFYSLSNMIYPYTQEIIFSFLDYYPKLPSSLRILTYPEMSYATQFLFNNLYPRFKLYSCAESTTSHYPYIKPSRCIDPDMFIKMGMDITDTDSKDTSQRLLCKCYPSKDIGEYRSCRHNCTYCYAR